MEPDYLVIGSGAVGMAFVDTLLDESDAHIIIVDRHGNPGGHWNDAHPLWRCTSRRPTNASTPPSWEAGAKDAAGPTPLYELAGGSEINASTRRSCSSASCRAAASVTDPMDEYTGDGPAIAPLLVGARVRVTVRRKSRLDSTAPRPRLPLRRTR